jgi:hypothetical protein
MRDAPVLMTMDEEPKALFSTNQEKRITQIAGLLKYLISEKILENIDKDEAALRARLHWFISAYWHVFAATAGRKGNPGINTGRPKRLSLKSILSLSYRIKREEDARCASRQTSVVYKGRLSPALF